MRNVNLLVLFLVIFSSCESTKPGIYFNRRKVIPAINSNCTAFQEGDVIDATNYISVSPEDYRYLEEYYDDKEFRLYVCLRYKKRCK